MWLRKPAVEHPYEWRVRILVWLTGGCTDVLMEVTWEGIFHPGWVTPALLMVQVAQLLYGNEATLGNVARVQYLDLLSEPDADHAPSEW